MSYQMLRDIIAARPKSFAFIAFLALLALTVTLYLSLWQQPELEKAQMQWFAKRQALAKGEMVGDATRYHNGVRDLELFRKRLPLKKDFASVLGRIYDTARNNSLSMKGVALRPANLKGEEGKGIFSYGVTFTLTGRYAGVKSFLADLARYPEMVTVDSVTLANTSQTEEAVSLSVQLTAYLKTEGA
ncbi:MAG TPA: pilus assembly protein PilO [Geobacter sp.]|nr:pilus assembly protein PilO [Geobacter sp.]